MRLFGYRDQKVVASDPSSPASGLMRYFSAFGKSFAKTSDGVKYDLTRNTQTINAVPNPNDANTGWGTSGVGVTVATTTTSTDLPLEGINGTAIKITPVSGTDYGHFRFTMPFALKNRGVSLSWVARALSGYVSGDLKLELYKNTASNYSGTYTRFTLSTDVSTITAIPLGNFVSSFTSDSADYYEIRFIRVTGTTAINVNELSVSFLVTGYVDETARAANVSGYGSFAAVRREVYEAYQTPTGQWRLKFSLTFAGGSATSNNNFEFSITGVTFKNVSDYDQPIPATAGVSGFNQSGAISAFARPNTNIVRAYTTNSPQPNLFFWSFNGDVELESQPAWV